VALGRRALLRGRKEHREGALEHFHVAANHVLDRIEAAAIAAERLRHAVAEFSLLAREEIDRSFEIARHDELHAVAVEADHLPEKIDRQKIRALILLLEDNLCENRTG